MERLEYDGVSGLRFGFKWIGRPKMFVYLYYVDGLLIDTGQSNMRRQVINETEEWTIDQIYITHHHEDHTGNLEPLISKYKCPVYGSKLCAELMTDPPSISWAQKITWGDRPPFFDIRPHEEILNTKNFSFQIISVPGHAADMVALYEPERRWLFSADLYINHYIGYFLDNESILQQIRSIEKVLELDFEVMFCSHNPQLNNPRITLRRKLDFLTDNYDRVERLYSEGRNAKEIFRSMELKENRFVKGLSGGKLSNINMVKSILRDIDQGQFS